MKEENRLKERGEVKHGAGKGCFVAVGPAVRTNEKHHRKDEDLDAVVKCVLQRKHNVSERTRQRNAIGGIERRTFLLNNSYL